VIMRRILANSMAFSLTELLLATLFAGLATAVLLTFFRDQLFRLRAQETRVATLEDVRGALDFMTRELRNAGVFSVETDETCDKDGSGKPLTVVDSDADSIEIQSDLDGDGNCNSPGERISYRLTAVEPRCSVLTRNGAALVGYCPGHQPSRQVSVRSAAGPLFTYYKQGDMRLDVDSPAFDPRQIKRIKIAMAVEEEHPDPREGGRLSTALSSSVSLRN